MNLRWFYFFIAGISILFSCNQKPSNNKAHREHLNQQTHHKNLMSPQNITVNDTIVENGLYNKLPTITLPFLPSNRSSNNKITSKIPALPYTSIDGKNIVYVKQQTRLIPEDSAFVIRALKALHPRIVNPDGGTGFGDFDCVLDSANCFNTDEYGKIGIVCALEVGTNYMCHIILTQKNWYDNDRGILALINPHGKILDWFFFRWRINSRKSTW